MAYSFITFKPCFSEFSYLCAHVCLVTQACPTLLWPMDGSPPGSSIHGISQARILEQVAISFSRVLPKLTPLSSPALQADSLPLTPPGKPPFSNLCCSDTQSCPTLCDPMDCSTPGFPAHHISRSLLKVLSAESVMPSNHLTLCCPLLLLPLIFPSIRVFSNESALRIRWLKFWFHFRQLASVLPMNIQGWSALGLTGSISLQFKELSSVFTVQKHQFFSIQPSLWSNSHIHTWLPKNP